MGPYDLIRACPFGYNTFFSFILIYISILNCLCNYSYDSETQ